VAVFLSASRSGSSIIKKILERHPDIASLSGEAEPFLALSGNGFLYTSDSDAIRELVNKDRLLGDIFDDLGVPAAQLCDPDTMKDRWRKRFLIQFPEFFSDDHNYKEMLVALDEASTEAVGRNLMEEGKIHELVLKGVFKD